MDRAFRNQQKFSTRFNSGGKTLTFPNKPSAVTPLVTTPTVTSPTTSPKMQPAKKLTYAEMRPKGKKDFATIATSCTQNVINIINNSHI